MMESMDKRNKSANKVQQQKDGNVINSQFTNLAN